MRFTSRVQFAIIRAKFYRVVNPLNQYLNQLLQLKNNFSVKIISGIDDAGNSALLKSFDENLRAEGVAPEEIIFIDCAADMQLKNFQQLYELVAERTAELNKFFLLVNDIERVAEWEKAINALFVGSPAEIYGTGSSYALAEKISALLPENCDTLKIYPQSFAEYAKNFSADDSATLQNYLRYGSLPATIGVDEKFLPTILRGVAYEILFNVAAKNFLHEIELFRKAIQMLAEHAGTATNFNRLSELSMSQTHFSNIKTIVSYFKNCERLFVKIPRLDIKQDRFKGGAYKLYCVDNGLLCAFKNFSAIDETTLIENAVCIELLRRGYKVSFGEFGAMNVSFVGERGHEKIFVQVLPTDGSVTPRKITRPLRSIDGGNKFLISMNREKIFGDIQNLTLKEFLSGS